MDNNYLKANVMPALTEAITAMAVQVPEDRVEFIGKYLLAYAARFEERERKAKSIDEAEKKLSEHVLAAQIKQDEIDLEQAPTRQKTERYEAFLRTIGGFNSREEAFDAVTSFLEQQLEIPAAYVAVRYVSGETVDVLKYVSKGNSDPLVLGKKVPKPAAEESEDAPERQGVSFEAFKVPEVPEAEEPPPEEEGAEPVVKGPPPLQPLSIINVMRDKRVKFFGIPKLGAYLAVPCTYSTVDHEAAVSFTPAEGETPASYALAPKDSQFLIAGDSIGAYRLFKQEEVTRISALGAALVELLTRLDAEAGARLKSFLGSEAFTAMNTSATEFAARIGELEAAALAPPAAAAPAEGEAAAPPAEEAPEVKAAKDSATVMRVWAQTISSSAIAGSLASLASFEVALPVSVLRLLGAIGMLTASSPTDYLDRCGDPSWTRMRDSGWISRLNTVLVNYDPRGTLVLLRQDQKFPAVKSYVESNGVLDAGSYPSFLPVSSAFLLPWLTKALAAREAQLAVAQDLEVAGWTA